MYSLAFGRACERKSHKSRIEKITTTTKKAIDILINY